MKTSSSQIGSSLLSVDFPGADDERYLARRRLIEARTRYYYEASQLAIPSIDYNTEEQETWRRIVSTMEVLHEGRMCQAYLKGKARLGLTAKEIPQLEVLDQIIQEEKGFRVQPVEGWIDAKSFFKRLSQREFYCTQYIRYWKEPSYTPEPDIVHEVLGHLPMMVFDNAFTEYSQLLGAAGVKANDEEMVLLERLYWFTSEFGMIREAGGIRIYGASPAGSMGEIQNCFKAEVEKIDFDLETVLKTEFPIYGFQPKFFVIDSFESLLETCRPFLNSIIQR